MNIRELARIAGVSPQQIRNYEDFGLFPPVPRSANGYRVYSERHLDALRATRAMADAGYSQTQALEVMQAIRSGDVATVLERIDARHAGITSQRSTLARTLAEIRLLVNEMDDRPGPMTRRREALRIGEAAREVGVRPSALRFWETEGLLQPSRDPASGYRLYDRREVQRLRVVALLRNAHYGFATIRSVLDEFAAGQPDKALRVVEQRRQAIAAASRACARATAALWTYLDDDAPAR
jgi:DNA-binding transcriptional MerR regulator